MKTEYLFRSCLFVPGHNERLLASAAKSPADVLLLDLEDSVQPATNKRVARDLIKDRVKQGDFAAHLVFPRVNDRESGFLLKDVSELTIDGIDGFMYPKSQKGEDVYFFDKLLETIEAEKGIELGTFKIIPLIETTSAIMHLQEICSISKRVVAIAFGCEDYITDLGGIHDKAGESIFTARSLIAAAAKANGIVPIDTVHINIDDLDDLEENLKLAKNLGFEGMLNLHPKEIELAHAYFSPSEEQVLAAKDMLRLYEESIGDDKGVAVVNGKFIGPPMVATAKKTLKKNNLIQAKSIQ
jgi:citrate lyase subunit beta/citryl-CoA lyase